MAEKFRRLWALLIAVLTDSVIPVTMMGRTAPPWLLHPRSLRIVPPLAGADGEGEGGGEGEGEGGAGGGEGEGEQESDWKALARKHETRSKQNHKLVQELQAKIDELTAGSKSEQEKALEQARKEARDEALTEAQKERRADRLEVAVTRLAARDLKVGDRTKRFADPDDALVNIQRAIQAGDLDEDDVFDSDGKVQLSVLTEALTDLLGRKPHLAATNGRPTGDADGGRGAGGGDTADMNDLIRRKARS